MKTIEREAVMDALRSVAPRAMHVAELCGRLDLSKKRREDVLDVLDALEALGLVTQMPGHRFRMRRSAPRSAPDNAEQYGTVVGRLNMNPRGFAFLAPEDGSTDVFLPPDSFGAALHGDRVEVRAKPSPKGREGRVSAVLERRPARITGTLQKRRRDAWIEPDDVRLRSPIGIQGELPEGKASGLAVVAELVRFPQSESDLPEARVLEILGVPGMTAVEVAKIKIRENIIEEFDEATRAEAAALPDRVLPSEKKDREDLRSLDLVTIDPADARDHDDALYVERTDEGYRLIVAIADVSHYVRPGTAIDRAANERCTSIYLPDRAIPMLPPELSTSLASLVPKKDRLCMAIEVFVSENGEILRHRLMEGVMRSRGKLTYEGVARALRLTKEPPKQPAAEKRRESLAHLLELSRTLRKKRLRRGALDFDLPEARIRLDSHNVEPVDIYRSRVDPGVREAYRIVEEMMLLANEVVAADLKARSVPAIYRVHGKPEERKLAAFADLANALGYEMDVERASNPKELSRFLTRIDGTEQAPVLRFLLLRAMQQAVYDTTPDVGHFGLGTKDYLHFTSPIRRYPDLAVHRVVKAVLREEALDAATLGPKLRRQAAESSRLERRAMVVERDVVDLYRCILMRDRIDEDFEARISSIEEYGFRVTFDEPFVDATVSVNSLADDYYELDKLGIRLIGSRTAQEYGLGDRVKVRLTEVDISRREMRAVPLTILEGERRPRRRRSRRRQDESNGQDKDKRQEKNQQRQSPQKDEPRKSRRHRRSSNRNKRS